MIPETLKNELRARVAEAVTSREAAVDVMKELQRHCGWLTDEAVQVAAEVLDLSPLQVEELATFYELIYRRPVGKRVIHVCDSISCWSCGCDDIFQYLQENLAVEPGGTTADGFFTLVPCACLGNCGEGPTMMIGDTLYGRLTKERVNEILQKERTDLVA
ncbi:MAG: NADH-quinone oxidoreductase subunit NuoE [Geobacteraceae bacterium]